MARQSRTSICDMSNSRDGVQEWLIFAKSKFKEMLVKPVSTVRWVFGVVVGDKTCAGDEGCGVCRS